MLPKNACPGLLAKCLTRSGGGREGLLFSLEVFPVCEVTIWLWVKKKSPRDHRFWFIFPLTNGFFGYAFLFFFDPQPFGYDSCYLISPFRSRGFFWGSLLLTQMRRVNSELCFGVLVLVGACL